MPLLKSVPFRVRSHYLSPQGLTWIGFPELLMSTSSPVSPSLSITVPPISSHPEVGVVIVLVTATAAASTIPVTAFPSSMVISVTTSCSKNKRGLLYFHFFV